MAHTSNERFFHYDSSLLPRPPHRRRASQGHLQDDMHPPLEPANMPWEDMLLQELDRLLKDSDRIGDQRLPPIYWVVAEHIRRRKDRFKIAGLAEQEYFEATVKQQGREHFFNLVEKAVNKWTKDSDELMAVLTYSMCLLWGVSGYEKSSGGFWATSSLPSREADKLVEVDSMKSQESGESQSFRCGDVPKIRFYPQPSSFLGPQSFLATPLISLRHMFIIK